VFTEYVDMTTTELIGSMYIPYDVIEDNLEKGALEDTLMDEIIPAKVARDLEKVVIQGDEDSQDTLLSAFDGVITKLTDEDVNVVEWDDETGIVTDQTWEDLLEALPDQYRELHPALRYYSAYKVGDLWVMYRRQRATGEGDSMVSIDHMFQHGYRGIPVQMCSQIPQTNALLTPPQNIILGMQRGTQIETARDIEARVIIIVVTLRVAVGIEEYDACVLGTGINISGTTTTEGN
jgi:hypothetical protein